jgi:U6 snRNA-associated Sm-like protein LSm7
VNEKIRVKFTGGREGASLGFLSRSCAQFPAVTGTLKGYDQLLNLVLDDVTEEVNGMILC